MGGAWIVGRSVVISIWILGCAVRVGVGLLWSAMSVWWRAVSLSITATWPCRRVLATGTVVMGTVVTGTVAITSQTVVTTVVKNARRDMGSTSDCAFPSIRSVSTSTSLYQTVRTNSISGTINSPASGATTSHYNIASQLILGRATVCFARLTSCWIHSNSACPCWTTGASTWQ